MRSCKTGPTRIINAKKTIFFPPHMSWDLCWVWVLQTGPTTSNLLTSNLSQVSQPLHPTTIPTSWAPTKKARSTKWHYTWGKSITSTPHHGPIAALLVPTLTGTCKRKAKRQTMDTHTQNVSKPLGAMWDDYFRRQLSAPNTGQRTSSLLTRYPYQTGIMLSR